MNPVFFLTRLAGDSLTLPSNYKDLKEKRVNMKDKIVHKQ